VNHFGEKQGISRSVALLVMSLCVSEGLYADASDAEVEIDIASIVSGIPRESAEVSSDQLWITNTLCTEKDEEIAATAANFLSKQKLKAAELLANQSLEFVCAFKAARNMFEDTSVDGFAEYLVSAPQFNATYFQGDKLGQWQCVAEEPLERDKIAALGLFSGNETLSWKIEASAQVALWLAPYKHQPSDAATFTWQYADGAWKIAAICLSSRI
jgi:hypothetical protein